MFFTIWTFKHSLLLIQGQVMHIELRNICVPVDFSDTSAAALNYAKALAEAFQAQLHLLHVLVNWIPDNDFPISPQFYSDLEKSARLQLDKLLTAQERDKFKARLELVNGMSEFVEIIRYAREKNIDLLVLGTHGRGPIAHMLLGSVAEKIVRKAPCPVLTVRHPEHEFVMP
ncbi:MAG TPA: universal stress protein [Pirellulales bacterium]|nr:universal stress protein [Pirellulales bacterium]